jgi:hypothetical protein
VWLFRDPRWLRGSPLDRMSSGLNPAPAILKRDQ